MKISKCYKLSEIQELVGKEIYDIYFEEGEVRLSKDVIYAITLYKNSVCIWLEKLGDEISLEDVVLVDDHIGLTNKINKLEKEFGKKNEQKV